MTPKIPLTGCACSGGGVCKSGGNCLAQHSAARARRPAHLCGLGLACASRALRCTAQVQVDGTHECTVAPAQNRGGGVSERCAGNSDKCLLLQHWPESSTEESYMQCQDLYAAANTSMLTCQSEG